VQLITSCCGTSFRPRVFVPAQPQTTSTICLSLERLHKAIELVLCLLWLGWVEEDNDVFFSVNPSMSCTLHCLHTYPVAETGCTSVVTCGKTWGAAEVYERECVNRPLGAVYLPSCSQEIATSSLSLHGARSVRPSASVAAQSRWMVHPHQRRQSGSKIPSMKHQRRHNSS
jgi:hypothetical protein